MFFLMPQTLLLWRARLFPAALELETEIGNWPPQAVTGSWSLLEAQYLFEVYITCQHFTVRFLASKTETVFLFFLKTDDLAMLGPHSPTWAPATQVRHRPGPCGQGKLQPQGNVCTQWLTSAMITVFILSFQRIWSLLCKWASMYGPWVVYFFCCKPINSEVHCCQNHIFYASNYF